MINYRHVISIFPILKFPFIIFLNLFEIRILPLSLSSIPSLTEANFQLHLHFHQGKIGISLPGSAGWEIGLPFPFYYLDECRIID